MPRLHARDEFAKAAVWVNDGVATVRYRAFISYSHHDKRWADWLLRALESWRAPKRLLQRPASAKQIPQRLAPIFRDRDELPSATDLGAKVRQALEDSANLIVICSPHAAQSDWVNEEVRTFKSLGRAERIFCLVVDGEPNPVNALIDGVPYPEAEECLVPALRYAAYAKGEPDSKRIEPMAADVRPGMDGKRNALLKLIAGMLELDFDALKQREHQRHVRRMGMIAAAAVLLMLVTSGLAFNAMLARNAAADARQTAEQRQDQAEQLVNFMLGDFNDKLREANRLDMLQTVNAQAMAYFSSLPNSDASDTTLQARAIALHRIGSVRMDQGLSEAALQAFQTASAIDAELLHRAPADAQRQASYAHGLNWIGHVSWVRGDLAQALDKFKLASATLQQASTTHPQLVELQAKLASVRTNTGRVLEARGDFSLAKQEYLEVLRIFENLSTAEPDNSRLAAELGYAYNNLGKVAKEQGDLAQAITYYQADQSIKAQLAAREPKNNRMAEALVISNAILGQALASCGETAIATRFLQDAVSGAQQLIRFDQDNTSYQTLSANYSLALAALARQELDIVTATNLQQHAQRTLAALVERDSTNMIWLRDLALSQLEGARLWLLAEQNTTAQEAADAGMQSIRTLRAKQPGAYVPMLIEARAYQLQGQIAAKAKHPIAAREWWQQARTVLQPLASASADPDYLEPWASVLLLLGDSASAKPVIAQLWNSGYRDPDFVSLLESLDTAYPPNQAFIDDLHTSLTLKYPKLTSVAGSNFTDKHNETE